MDSSLRWNDNHTSVGVTTLSFQRRLESEVTNHEGESKEIRQKELEGEDERQSWPSGIEP